MHDVAQRLAQRLFDRPLIQNSFRGAFVEELIAPYMSKGGWRHCGDDWGSWDFEHPSGSRLELKQSAAVQSWSNDDAKIETSPSFNISAKSGYWAGKDWFDAPGRHANIYLFAWHGERSLKSADHRTIDQWEFFALNAGDLPRQRSIKLGALRALGAVSTSADHLLHVVERLRVAAE